MANVSLFEQTMHACQAMKAESAKRSTKKKMTSKKKAIVESKSVKRRKRIQEAEELDPEIDDVEDEPIADDVDGDIVAVVDPDMSSDEYDDKLDDLNDIVDSTPEGEVPTDDSYVGDDIYQCPICGNPFFTEDDLSDGGICPVCGEEVDAFVALGTVESEDEASDEEEVADDVEDIEDDVDDIEDVEDDEELEECNMPVKKGKKECGDTLQLNDVSEEYNPPKTPKKRPGVGSCDAKCEKYYKYSIDEKSLNPFLTKMIRENYKNAVSMKLIRPSIKGSTLKLECLIKYKSGKCGRTVITVENFKPARKMNLAGKLGSTFKAESYQSKPQVTIGAKIVGKTIKVESFKYNYVVKKESKKLNVYGSYALKESAKRK